MGMQKKYIRYIEDNVKNNFMETSGKSMLELGDQVLKGMKRITKFKTSKQYFEEKGYSHMSIDLNGKNGSIKLDLAESIIDTIGNKFDIITNMGTTEHVEPMSGQYQCFKNIHELLNVGGLVFHILPDIEERMKDSFSCNHANNYYKEDFFRMLYNYGSGYQLLDLSRKRYNFRVCAKKIENIPFMEDKELFFSNTILSSGGKIWKGINDRA